MVVTTSDVERLHKVYSLIHTPLRNRLKQDKVDLICSAQLATRQELLVEKPFFQGLDQFEKLSDLEEQGLNKWGEMIALAEERTIMTISQPTQTVVMER